jgi:D-glycero-alpha-D-manno-heptose-7-phosphate kinase
LVTQGLEIHLNGDLPARSAWDQLLFHGRVAEHPLRPQGRLRAKAALAAEATRIEQEVIGESVGWQDQLWAAYGGLNRIDFARDRGTSVKPLILSAARRRELVHLLLFSGLSRFLRSGAIKDQQHEPQRAQLLALRQMVDDAMELMVDESEPIHRIGELLHESWGVMIL